MKGRKREKNSRSVHFPSPGHVRLKGTAGHLHTLPLAATPENAEGYGYTYISRTQPGNWRRQKREREINIQFLVNNARLGREGEAAETKLSDSFRGGKEMWGRGGRDQKFLLPSSSPIAEVSASGCRRDGA